MDKEITADTTPPVTAGAGRQMQEKNLINRGRATAVLTLLGTPSYVLCSTHFCMGGHMAHGPYPRYQLASDFWWLLCFACVIVMAFRLKARGHRLFFYGSLCLILFAPVGVTIIALPVLLFMDSLAIAYLIMPKIFLTRERQPPADATQA